MSETAYRFRTTKGVVTVRPDAVERRSTLRQRLAGQRARWRNGGRWERTKMAGLFASNLTSIPALSYLFSSDIASGDDVGALLIACSIVVFAYAAIWREFVRGTTIPVAAIEAIDFDAGKRRLEITHETADGLLSVVKDDESETTIALPSDDEVREAREIFRLQGVTPGWEAMVNSRPGA